MPAIFTLLSLIFLLSSRHAMAAEATQSWLYLNTFQSNTLVAVNPMTGTVESAFDVEDGAGSLGLGVSSDGRRLFVVDGDTTSRLRVLDAATSNTLAEHIFDHRVLLLGGGPVVHLTADNRLLLVSTYDYAAAATGVRVFDVRNGRFTPLGLRGRGCDSPRFVSAQGGTLISVCPNFLQSMPPVTANMPYERVGGKKVPTFIENPADAVLSADGTHLYVVNHFDPDRPWLLVHWSYGDKEATNHDLRELLDIHDDIPDPRGRAIPWLGLSPDTNKLALVAGPHMWLLERATLRVVGHQLQPHALNWAVFTFDGREVLTMHSSPDGRTELLRVSAATGEINRVPLGDSALQLRRRPTIFVLAPAP